MKLGADNKIVALHFIPLTMTQCYMDTKTKTNIPSHLGIIMDGNRRWAQERNLPSQEGYLEGYRKMYQIPEFFFARGVKIISIYAFSIEHWSRNRVEINYLMKLLKQIFRENLEEFKKREYRLLISGRINDLPGDLFDVCMGAINETAGNTKGILNICVNYGGQFEIVDALKKMLKKGITVDQVSRAMVRRYLYNNEVSDPDMIIRTGGVKRLSGFQLWRSAYSELMFMEKYWPDFEKNDIDIILKEYHDRISNI